LVLRLRKIPSPASRKVPSRFNSRTTSVVISSERELGLFPSHAYFVRQMGCYLGLCHHPPPSFQNRL
jgi:hypothetical protein